MTDTAVRAPRFAGVKQSFVFPEIVPLPQPSLRGVAIIASSLLAILVDGSSTAIIYLENDPRQFAGMYERARAGGLHLTAHAGETGPAAFVRDSIDVLGCERIDHGYHIIDDPVLVARSRRPDVFHRLPDDDN